MLVDDVCFGWYVTPSLGSTGLEAENIVTGAVAPPVTPTVVIVFDVLRTCAFSFSESPFPVAFPEEVIPTLTVTGRGARPVLQAAMAERLTTATSIPEYPEVARCVRGTALRRVSFPETKDSDQAGSPGDALLQVGVGIEFGLASLLEGRAVARTTDSVDLRTTITVTAPMTPDFNTPGDPGVGITFEVVFGVGTDVFGTVLVIAHPVLHGVTEWVSMVPRRECMVPVVLEWRRPVRVDS